MALLSALIGAVGAPLMNALMEKYITLPAQEASKERLGQKAAVQWPQELTEKQAAWRAGQTANMGDLYNPQTGLPNQANALGLFNIDPQHAGSLLSSLGQGWRQSAEASQLVPAQAAEQRVLGEQYYPALANRINLMAPYEASHLVGQTAGALAGAKYHGGLAEELGKPTMLVQPTPGGGLSQTTMGGNKRIMFVPQVGLNTEAGLETMKDYFNRTGAGGGGVPIPTPAPAAPQASTQQGGVPAEAYQLKPGQTRQIGGTWYRMDSVNGQPKLRMLMPKPGAM